MSARIHPALLTQNKRQQMLSNSPEKLREHPTAFYRAGFDALAATGLVEPQQDYVLLRAITGFEIEGVPAEDRSIVLAGDDRLGDVQAFAIVAVGPVVQQLQSMAEGDHQALLARQDAGVGMVRIHYPAGSLEHIKPGNHCISIASAADALDASGDGMYQLVRACFLPCAWPADVADAVVEVVEETRQEWAAAQARADEAKRKYEELQAVQRAESAKINEELAAKRRAPAVHIAPEHRSAG